MNKTAVIFDLDGTLWDSSDYVYKIWNGVFETLPNVDLKITRETLYGLMGKPMDEIGAILFPQFSTEEQNELMLACTTAENAALRESGAELYEGLEATLRLLCENRRLYIVSNCQQGYIEAFLCAHKLERYFSDIEMFGRTGKSKGENIRLLMERNGLTMAVYVGDTQGDRTAAAYAEIPFIYARYGFGDVSDYDYIIDKITDLPDLVQQFE